MESLKPMLKNFQTDDSHTQAKFSEWQSKCVLTMKTFAPDLGATVLHYDIIWGFYYSFTIYHHICLEFIPDKF